MIINLEIKDIDPRQDAFVVVQKIEDYLNRCDPDDRPELRIECPK